MSWPCEGCSTTTWWGNVRLRQWLSEPLLLSPPRLQVKQLSPTFLELRQLQPRENKLWLWRLPFHGSTLFHRLCSGSSVQGLQQIWRALEDLLPAETHVQLSATPVQWPRRVHGVLAAIAVSCLPALHVPHGVQDRQWQKGDWRGFKQKPLGFSSRGFHQRPIWIWGGLRLPRPVPDYWWNAGPSLQVKKNISHMEPIIDSGFQLRLQPALWDAISAARIPTLHGKVNSFKRIHNCRFWGQRQGITFGFFNGFKCWFLKKLCEKKEGESIGELLKIIFPPFNQRKTHYFRRAQEKNIGVEIFPF